MPGDRTQPAADEGDDEYRDKAVSGPRHAAPRKSLLTKLHVPAGKAVALAAVPTAVLMGMGMTPHLARADEQPSNPFKPGPCVTQSEKPPATGGASDAKDAGGKDSDGKGSGGKDSDGKGSGGKDGAADGGSGTKPTTSPTTTPTTTPTHPADKPGTGTGGSDAPDPTVTPTAPAGRTLDTPPSKEADPLDPLGLGNLLGGLLGRDASATTPATTASTTPTPSATGTPTSDTDPATGKQGGGTAVPSGGTVENVADTSGTPAKPPVGSTLRSATKALRGHGSEADAPTSTPSPHATVKAADATSGGDSTPGDEQSYPCPTLDAQALADAKVEGGIPLLADKPWTLKSSRLTLYGLQYKGIVKVRTWSGEVKDVLKFTASGVDIRDLQQIVQGPGSTTTHVEGRAGSTSTIRSGTVTMYTESLSGDLLGAIPVTFTPKAPPPLTLPVLWFTHVTVVQAAQFGGTLHIPGMRVRPGLPAS